MKKILFLFVALAMSVMGAMAQDWTDQSTLKVSPGMVNGDFADGTVFYQIQNKKSGYLSTAAMSGASLSFTTANLTADAARWAILGDNVNGFQFVNKATKEVIGMNKFEVTNQENQSNATSSYMTGDLADANTKFALAPHYKTAGYFIITPVDDHFFYWNQLSTLGYWYSGEGYEYGYYGWKKNNNGDDGASFKFNEVETLISNTYTFVLPAGVTVTYNEKDYTNGQSVTIKGAMNESDLTIAPAAPDGYVYKVTFNEGNVNVELAELFPNPTKQYIIGNAGGDRSLYIVLAPGDDSQGDSSNATQASFATKAGATPFTFTPSGTGFVISTVDGETTKYLGANGGWNVGTTQQTVWTLVEQEEGVYALNRGGSNHLGSDGLVAGNGIYTDKAIAKNGKWFLEEYVAPTESHNVLVYLDDATEGAKMLPAEEEGAYVATLIGLTAGAHTVSVTYDGGEPVVGSFTSTTKNDKITVHYKDGVVTFENDVVTITLGAAGYATLYSDRDLNFAYSGAEVYVLSESETEGYLHAERVDNAKALTGVIVKGAAGETYEFNHLTNNSEATSVLEGVLVDTPAPANCLVLGYEDDTVGFYKYTGTLAAGKAYYVPAAESVSRVLVDFDGEVTAIDLSPIAPTANEIFDLQGRRVVNAKSGLYIVNGKKVIK